MSGEGDECELSGGVESSEVDMAVVVGADVVEFNNFSVCWGKSKVCQLTSFASNHQACLQLSR